MALSENKKYAFEYIVYKLVQWSEEMGIDPLVNLSKLKIIKLHFFICANSTTPNNSGLLKTFDKFFAMPFGHIESEIYSAILNDELEYYLIENNSISFKKNFEKKNFGDKNDIDNSVDELKIKNINLISYNAFDLVDLSHSWTSWSSMYNLAQSRDKFSIEIPETLIQKEQKFYSLNI